MELLADDDDVDVVDAVLDPEALELRALLVVVPLAADADVVLDVLPPDDTLDDDDELPLPALVPPDDEDPPLEADAAPVETAPEVGALPLLDDALDDDALEDNVLPPLLDEPAAEPLSAGPVSVQ
ncbi:MAG: hypothetical protein AB2A00_19180 [Myxococcota bacterium]